MNGLFYVLTTANMIVIHWLYKTNHTMEKIMKLIAKQGEIEIWETTADYGFGRVTEYYVFGITCNGDAVVCPSIGMAHEKAGI